MTDSSLIELTIDGKNIQVPKGTTVYQAAKQMGIEIPIFCYHERMPPFGACRMCLVQVEKMGKLQASCTLEALPGMVVNTQAQMAVDGRKEILELLLINHPLDCPICDRGGECPLQDNALRYGPGLSRFFEEKRKFKKQLPLGPVLMLDRERCIVCARCTRFGDVLAGDHALEFKERGFRTEVGTKDNQPVKSKFIGNTIMICPVGALTSQVYRFRARPWDNDTTHSTCTLCPVGCSMKLDSRDGEIMRTRSQDNPAVNDIWLCDKGWFGYEFSSSPERLQTPLIRRNEKFEEASWEEAISLIASKASQTKKIGALGGNPLTTEENYLFQELVRKGFKSPHIDHRIGMPILSVDKEGQAPGMQMEIADLESLPFIALLGLDLTEEFPVLWLRLRQAINKGAKVIFIGHFSPEIAPYLSEVVLHPPGKELETLQKHLSDKNQIGAYLVGNQYLASNNRVPVLSFLSDFTHCSLNIMEGQDNSMGARLAGVRPDLAPLGKSPLETGLDALSIMQTMSLESWGLLYVAGANPAIKLPGALWKKARENLEFLVVQDLFLTETAAQADVVLPVLTFTEKKGSFVNIEGRIQPLQPGKQPPENILSDGEIFLRIAQKLNVPLIFEKEFSEMLKLKKLPVKKQGKIKTESPYSASEGLQASFAYALFDQGIRMEHNEHLSKLIKPPPIRLHPSTGIANGATIKMTSKEGVIEGVAEIDASVAVNTVVIPIGFKTISPFELSANLVNGTPINLEVM